MPTSRASIWSAVLTAATALVSVAHAEPLPLPDACRSKTDGCQVCSLADGKVVACSLPGIACSKGEWRCNEPATATIPPLPEAAPAPAPAPPETAPVPSKEPDPVPAP